MVIVPIMSRPVVATQNLEAAANVQAWTMQASEALQSVTLSTEKNEHPPRATVVKLSIPLDSTAHVTSAEGNRRDAARPKKSTQAQAHTSYEQRTLVRRDSLDRREAFLKGNVGSRQRRRWENGESLAT